MEEYSPCIPHQLELKSRGYHMALNKKKLRTHFIDLSLSLVCGSTGREYVLTQGSQQTGESVQKASPKNLKDSWKKLS